MTAIDGHLRARDERRLRRRQQGDDIRGDSPFDAQHRAVAERLLVAYSRCSDDADVEGWADLFGSDGILFVFGKELTGRDRLTRFATRAPLGVHIQGMADFTPLEGGAVGAESSFMFVNATSRQVVAGWYHDRIIPAGDGYRFDRREVDMRVAPQ